MDVTPIFDLGNEFDGEITIGTKVLPVKVKRMTRVELKEFRKKFATYFPTSAGKAAPTFESDADKEKFDEELIAFTEDSLKRYLMIPPGFLRDRGQDVVDGNGFIEMFHSRRDALSSALIEIISCNTLTPLIRGNSKPPRVSASGSEALTPTRGGAGQGLTAPNAEGSTTADRADATNRNETSSGEPREEKKNVH